ncbi:MAG: hypothetical protein KJP27_05115 [Altererythrobacter sp.]|nr:hypothetical protein [Altererythrobacter sp.]
MRRTKLTWFALGASSVLASWAISVSMFGAEEEPPTPHIVISAPDILYAESNFDELDNFSFKVGEVVSQCGLEAFEIELNLHGLAYVIPITDETEPALGCLVENFGNSSDPVSFEIKAS